MSCRSLLDLCACEIEKGDDIVLSIIPIFSVPLYSPFNITSSTKRYNDDNDTIAIDCRIPYFNSTTLFDQTEQGGIHDNCYLFSNFGVIVPNNPNDNYLLTIELNSSVKSIITDVNDRIEKHYLNSKLITQQALWSVKLNSMNDSDLSNYQNSKLTEKLSYKQNSIKDKEVMRKLKELLQQELTKYTTSIEEDEKLINEFSDKLMDKNVVQYRIQQKKILNSCIENLQTEINK